jgi:hypothetical protein
VTSSTWFSEIFTFTPAVSPADNFVLLSFFNGDSTLALLFRTTLGAFDGSTFYPGVIDIDTGTTGSGFDCLRLPSCTQEMASPFVSGSAAPRVDLPPPPPPPAVPEPTTMALVVGGLVAIAGRRIRRRRA